MNLAFVVFKYFPFGGMQRNMLAIAKACVARDHSVTVICSEWQGEKPASLSIEVLPINGWSNGQQMENFYEQFCDFKDQKQFDLLVGFNKFPGLDAYYAADSCFAKKAYEESSWLSRLTKRSKIYLAYESAVYSHSSPEQKPTHILEVSSSERPVFKKYYNTEAERFHSLPPGISKDRIVFESKSTNKNEVRRELGVSADATVFIALGSGFRTKGLDRSLELLADWQRKHDTNCYLLVVGQDRPSSTRHFKSLAKKLSLSESVKFLGGRNDIPRLLQAADVLLHPAYKENTGNVLLETMLAGTPAAASAVCGYAHYIESANMGEVIAEPFTQQSLLDAVEKIMAVNTTEWQLRAGRLAAQEDLFSRPLHVAKLLEMFQNILPAIDGPEPAQATLS